MAKYGGIKTFTLWNWIQLVFVGIVVVYDILYSHQLYSRIAAFVVVLFLCRALFFQLKKVYLKTYGTKIMADIKNIEFVELQKGSKQYRIIAEWLNPETNITETFQSQRYPVPYVKRSSRARIYIEPKIDQQKGAQVSVYIFSKNSKFYFVDFPHQDMAEKMIQLFEQKYGNNV